MIFDSHSHTEFSADSEMKAEDALKKAKEEGVGLVFTEHLDLDYPGDMDFTFDSQKYWQSYEKYRGDTLRLGVEIGMNEAICQQNKAFVQEVPFDLVIGSQHIVDGQDIYYPAYYEGKTKKEAFHRYYELMAENLRRHGAFIDVLGHIDYISRYAPYDNPEVSYGEFHEDIDAVLRAAVETDTVMELNTRRLGSRRALKELMPVYTRYKELGGKFLMLGSDAHVAENVAMNFKAAAELADMAGLQLVTFKERRLEYCTK
ncbi:histidinol-phosphatase HisJ family protein [uncultured Mitsuokella sp.]|uniref:histidinol-phosphatase HisJ family protein n=1 Tax=uncultured Mitsuokella sp. TaxID=453120 RepID=UPI0025EFC236|nr:histidinol-phosphatase HisJ family protein [uncultured Mitsuokella sp.]